MIRHDEHFASFFRLAVIIDSRGKGVEKLELSSLFTRCDDVGCQPGSRESAIEANSTTRSK